MGDLSTVLNNIGRGCFETQIDSRTRVALSWSLSIAVPMPMTCLALGRDERCLLEL